MTGIDHKPHVTSAGNAISLSQSTFISTSQSELECGQVNGDTKPADIDGALYQNIHRGWHKLATQGQSPDYRTRHQELKTPSESITWPIALVIRWRVQRSRTCIVHSERHSQRHFSLLKLPYEYNIVRWHGFKANPTGIQRQTFERRMQIIMPVYNRRLNPRDSRMGLTYKAGSPQVEDFQAAETSPSFRKFPCAVQHGTQPISN